MSKALALQKALRARFVASPAVLALVPAASIIDRHLRPAPSPSVILGEETAGPDAGNLGRDREELFHTLHVWQEEPGTVGVKQIMAALGDCLGLDPRPDLDGGYHLADWQVASRRAFRDPDGKTAHGVLTIRALIGGAA